MQREPEDVGRLEGRFRHTVSRHQLGDGNALTRQRQRLLDPAQPGVALSFESGLERMRQTNQLAGGDDVVLTGAEVRSSRAALSDEGTDGVDETAQHRRRLGRRRIAVDP